MQRREVLVTLVAAAAAPQVLAHHGWSSFDTARPIYLAGRIARLSWSNPHAELQLEVDTDLKLPEGLAARTVPEQQARVDMKDLLARAVVPTRKDRLWQIELAPLFRMNAWKVPQPREGDRLSLLGYTFAGEKGEAIARVEVLFIGDAAYPLRSGPA
jgi:hypothetical protein